MFNPFEQDDSAYSPEAQLPYSLSQEQPSPISLLQQDRLSEHIFPQDLQQLDCPDKKVYKLLCEVKNYSQSLEQRNIQIACELERERNKNKKLMSAMGLLMSTEEERSKSLEEKIARLTENSSKFQVQLNRRQMVESEVKALRLENTYLKDLILVANDNYQKLEQKNSQLLQKITSLEQEYRQREVETLRQTEELKALFSGLVGQRVVGDAEPKGSPKAAKVKREHAEDAYRSIFSKTLRPRKQNIHRQ